MTRARHDLGGVLDVAVAAARPYGALDAALRAAFLREIADQLESRADELVETAQRESALGVARLTGELTRTTGQLRMFADLVADGSWAGARIDSGPPAIRRLLVPIGPVAVFGASNFPLAFSVAGGDTASALAAGCPVVCKAHPAHPETSVIAATAIDAAVTAHALPSGVFSLVAPAAGETDVDFGQRLVADDRIEAVAFTGSLAGGRALFDIAATRPRPVPLYAEMGSVNPVFVLPGAAAERSAEIAGELADSITLGAGQFCTNPGVIVVLADSPLADDLTAAMSGRPVATMLTPAIAAAYARGVATQVDSGARLVAGSAESGRPALARVDAERFINDAVLRREVFGPMSVVVETADVDGMLAVACALEGQLTATVYAAEGELAGHGDLIDALVARAGRVIFGGVPTGVAVNNSMQHGGPYPASTDARTTSVGTAAIERFARPVCFQDFPEDALPALLRDANPLGAIRLVDGVATALPIATDLVVG